MRGGANGGRIRLQPQLGWEVNEPDELAQVIRTLEGIQAPPGSTCRSPTWWSWPATWGRKGRQGSRVRCRGAVHPGRGDATQEQTDVESFSYLEPKADGFPQLRGQGLSLPAEYQLIDRANLLGLSGPEMTVLVGGLRVLDTNFGGTKLGVLTGNPGALTTDFFVNLLDMGTKWAPSPADDGTYVGKDRTTGADKYTASRVDLLFGSNSQLRALAEVYAEDDARRSSSRTSSRRGSR